MSELQREHVGWVVVVMVVLWISACLWMYRLHCDLTEIINRLPPPTKEVSQ